MQTTLNYSLNFDVKKRKPHKIKFLIFHYTGMKREIDAIDRLTNKKTKVSSNYFIKKNGEILTLVPELYIAWHAGISYWKKYKLLNKHSIGIEISNSGHNYKYSNFTKLQIKSIIKLSKYLIKKYKIKSNFILGHSDIAPYRKIDPGEKFPWRHLSKRQIGSWHNINSKILLEERNKKINKLEKSIFFKNLNQIGYVKNSNIKTDRRLKKITSAFQRRFRQELINGIVDRECFIISKNLLKKFK